MWPLLIVLSNPNVELAFGWITAKLQQRFEASRTATEIYVLQFATVWLGFLTVGSIEVLAQIALYSSIPIYVYLFSRNRRRGVPVPTYHFDEH
jgi:hypothetical protein